MIEPIILLAMLTAPAPTGAEAACAESTATAAYRAGFEAQQRGRSDDALAHYRRCLDVESGCTACLYEIGWSHWSRSEWRAAVRAWEQVLAIDPAHEDARTWLPQARERAAPKRRTSHSVPIGTRSTPHRAPVSLELVARFQNYRAHPSHPADHFDQDINSPKSARFSGDGGKVYVNSLEGQRTVIYDARTLEKRGTILHQFGPEHAALFRGQEAVFGYRYRRRPAAGDPNQFSGRPVESALSHGGRHLWIPYYRRDFDRGATSPSAVAIVDTATDTIVRVMPTGPIPKFIAISPDNRWAAVVHWGANTVGLIDISSGDPATFTYVGRELVVERALAQSGLEHTDRDRSCGFCLRGAVFTPDGTTLLVARMGGGGIAGFDVGRRTYLGTVLGMKPTPRHLTMSPDGRWLYLSANVSGYVARIALAQVLAALETAGGTRARLADWEAVRVGAGARTIDLSPDGRFLFVAVNSSAELAVIDTAAMRVAARVRTDDFTVGLAVSPDGSRVWTTSQGRKGRGGGNSVCVFAVRYRSPDEPPATGRAQGPAPASLQPPAH